MGLFSKLFGTEKSEEKDSTPIQQKSVIQQKPIIQQKSIKTVFDILEINLKELPDDTFVTGATSDNTAGALTTPYRKNLTTKVYDIFDTMEIIRVENSTAKNMTLSTVNIKSVRIDKLKTLIDTIFLLYGEDSFLKGKLSHSDIEDLKSEYWGGRMWTDEKYKYPVVILRDDNGLSMTVWTLDC